MNKESIKNVIIFDLDGTLANIEHRRHFVTRTRESDYTYKLWKPDWDAFYKACVDDTPNKAMQFIWRMIFLSLPNDVSVEVWSGRDESVFKETNEWLNEHYVKFLPGFKDFTLNMRPTGDYTPDEELKRKWLYEVGKENVLMVFDDRDKVVKMWRDEGITCLQVADGNF